MTILPKGPLQPSRLREKGFTTEGSPCGRAGRRRRRRCRCRRKDPFPAHQTLCFMTQHSARSPLNANTAKESAAHTGVPTGKAVSANAANAANLAKAT
ncbi:MAG TPA: hypothetical protein PLQ56_03505 [Aggregatilineales bacterium]|nr:hypothetical protein [Aggregatilineales bacterium]